MTPGSPPAPGQVGELRSTSDRVRGPSGRRWATSDGIGVTRADVALSIGSPSFSSCAPPSLPAAGARAVRIAHPPARATNGRTGQVKATIGPDDPLGTAHIASEVTDTHRI